MKATPLATPEMGPLWSEGGFWGGLLFLDTYFLKKSVDSWRGSATSKEPHPNKDLLLSTLSFSSSVALAVHWLGKTIVWLPLAAQTPLFLAIGLGGRGLVGSTQLAASGQEFFQRMVKACQISDPKELRTLMTSQLVLVLQIAFYVTFIAWSGIGAFAALSGSGVYAPLVDSLFYHSGVLFLGVALSILFLERGPKKG